jgi:hypothetical protein
MGICKSKSENEFRKIFKTIEAYFSLSASLPLSPVARL